jgi:hypothetical protein
MANLDSIRRGIVPRASDEQVRSLLWCCTTYPFRKDLRKLRRSLRRELKAGGGTVAGAIEHAHAELDRAMAEYKAQEVPDGGR